PWHTSVSQTLPSGFATQNPASAPRNPQPHLDGVPALTLAEPVQAISPALCAHVSQWKKSTLPSDPETVLPFESVLKASEHLIVTGPTGIWRVLLALMSPHESPSRLTVPFSAFFNAKREHEPVRAPSEPPPSVAI